LSKARILLISYLFPPAGGIAVQRCISLAKYLCAYGFEVHVLKARTTGPVHDPSLLTHVPPAVTVHDAFTPDIPFALRQKLWARFTGSRKEADNGAPATQPAFPLRQLVANVVKRVLSPEPEITWVPFALRKARKIVRKHGIEFVLVSVPPFSALMVGTALKAEFPSLTLVSDFRDEWLSFYLKEFDFQNTEFTRRRAEVIERAAVTSSDLVVAVNRSSCDEIRRRYPQQPDRKFKVVPNGYDPEVFRNFQPRQQRSAHMVVTHIGTVYKTASPVHYLDALDAAPDELRNGIETRFIGRIVDNDRGSLEARRHPVKVIGFLPQAEALEYMEETDYLLLTMTNEISIPGKLYEYMAGGKPILAITPAGSEVDRIVRETGCGLTAAPDNPQAIRDMLGRAFLAWRTGQPLVRPNTALIRSYERPRLVAEYAGIMQAARCGEAAQYACPS
jgi:glycosyltransferase involved in cell wall biosynthesis